MRALTLLTLLALVTLGGCGLGDGEITEEGEPCRSDFDCPEDMECVPAESPNATAVCMPIL